VPATAERLAWDQPDLPDVVVDALLALENSTIGLALDRPRQSRATRRRIAEHPNVEVREARRRFIEHMIKVGNRVMPDDLADYAGPDGLAGLARSSRSGRSQSRCSTRTAPGRSRSQWDCQ
jgi:hypothetical protein